jgi:transposase
VASISLTLAAIAGGMSGRQAAIRFDVSPASVSRWRKLEREQGDVRPGPLGGDRRSGRTEAHAQAILSLAHETPDMTLEELRAQLSAKGTQISYGALWRFFDRHDYTLKKRPRTRASRSVPIS